MTIPNNMTSEGVREQGRIDDEACKRRELAEEFARKVEDARYTLENLFHRSDFYDISVEYKAQGVDILSVRDAWVDVDAALHQILDHIRQDEDVSE